MFYRAFLAVSGAGLCVGALATELLTNGDFEGSGGFASGYSYVSTDAHPAGTYSIVSSPHDVHSSWASFADHSPNPAAKMAVFNGSTVAGRTVWTATTCAVPNTDVTFSGWTTSCFGTSPANLAFYANGTQMGSLQLPGSTGVWDHFSITANAGNATTITFKIVDLNTAGNGNDFALDDLSVDGDLLARSVAGNVLLSDFVGEAAGRTARWTLLSGSATVATGDTVLGAGGSYSVSFENMCGDGLAIKVDHWLRQRISVSMLTDLTDVDFTLTNGDVDDDNEVGPGDFGALSAAFGSVDGDGNWNPMADLDGDGEVGPSDFGILSANFGLSGD